VQRWLSQYRYDTLKHGVEIVQHILVGKPHDAIVAWLIEPAGALGVILDLLRVAVAIDFDD